MFQEKFGFKSELVKGSGGILEVLYNGDVVWTNRENRGVKPSNDEAEQAMRDFLAQKEGP